jgi:hypothetical protein
MPIHIKPQSPTGTITAPFVLADRAVPAQLFRAYIHGETFNENRQFWLSKDGGKTLEQCRIESVEFKDLPGIVSDVALDMDGDRDFQRYRLYVGDSKDFAEEIEPDTESSRRWSVLISIG